MAWDILRYSAFAFFLLVLLPYTVIALWGIVAWTKALVTGKEPADISDGLEPAPQNEQAADAP